MNIDDGNENEPLQAGGIEINESEGVPRVRFQPPQEWFTLPELREFAAYLTLLADENEPSAEVNELAGIIETAQLLGGNSKVIARRILAAAESGALLAAKDGDPR